MGKIKVGDLDIPTSRCPHCKREELDFDGCGVVAHTWPDYPEGCGWCSHPTIANGLCEICGAAGTEPPGVQPGMGRPVPRDALVDDERFDWGDDA